MLCCLCFVTYGDAYRYLWCKSSCHFRELHCSSTSTLSLLESSTWTKCSASTSNTTKKTMAGEKHMREDPRGWMCLIKNEDCTFLYRPRRGSGDVVGEGVGRKQGGWLWTIIPSRQGMTIWNPTGSRQVQIPASGLPKNESVMDGRGTQGSYSPLLNIDSERAKITAFSGVPIVGAMIQQVVSVQLSHW